MTDTVKPAEKTEMKPRREPEQNIGVLWKAKSLKNGEIYLRGMINVPDEYLGGNVKIVCFKNKFYDPQDPRKDPIYKIYLSRTNLDSPAPKAPAKEPAKESVPDKEEDSQI